MIDGGNSHKASFLAAGADLLAAALAAGGTTALLANGIMVRVGGLRLSMRTPWRSFIWAAVILLVRTWLAREAPFAWLARLCRLAVRVWVPSLLRHVRTVTLAAAFSLKRWVVDPAVASTRKPLPLDERALFWDRLSWRAAARLGLLFVGFSAFVAALTWPQASFLGDAVSDLGDPLFSIWRIAWVSHQLPRHPLDLFEANIFYPEHLTLTYSDALPVPALMSAPFFWIGVHPVLIYNVLLLSGFVLSGVTMFLLVRALTGSIEAGVVSGAIFAVYPYRLEHYSHLELQMTMWMPLALWGLHRTLASARLRDGLATGLAFALQTLSSLYYGCFFAVYMVVLGGALWLARGRPWRTIGPLAAGAALAAALVAPVAAEYMASLPTLGVRSEETARIYSAEGRDYLKPHFRSLTYGRWSKNGHAERQLFPRLTPVVLTAVALWPPLSAARIAYTLALMLAVDGSFGFNGATFPWLRASFSPFQMIRVPARFSLLAGMTLAILAGYGAVRLLNRWPRRRLVLTAAMLACVSIEALPNIGLDYVWPQPPAIYDVLAGKPPAVLAEFPMPAGVDTSWFDSRYLYFSTFHWQKLVNGNSGFFPRSYVELLSAERDFPSEAALAYLRSRSVEYLAVHGRFYRGNEYARVIAALDARHDLEMVAAAPWRGFESRLYRLR